MGIYGDYLPMQNLLNLDYQYDGEHKRQTSNTKDINRSNYIETSVNSNKLKNFSDDVNISRFFFEPSLLR